MSVNNNVVVQASKCSALTWLMACERPSIVRHCSEEAAVVMDESIAAALDLVAPECEAAKDLAASTVVFKAKRIVADNNVNTKRHIDEAAFNGVCNACTHREQFRHTRQKGTAAVFACRTSPSRPTTRHTVRTGTAPTTHTTATRICVQ